MESPKQQSTSQTNYSSWNDTGPATKHSYAPPSTLSNSPSRSKRRAAEATEDYSLETDEERTHDQHEDIDDFDDEELATVHHKQRYAPLSTAFVVVQVIILPLMMWQCGVAPLEINPMIGPYPDALNYWGAKNAVLIIDDGELYRLITPIFLHAGLIHLAGNVLVQMDSGNRWEKEWGSLIWIIVYIGSAIGSSVLSVIAMPDQISVGSSGSIMGLFGAKFAEIIVLMCEKGTTVRELAAEQSRKEQACHVIFGIIIVMAMSFIPYVDWAAHLGGLVAGFAIGIVCFSFTMRNKFGTVFWLGVGVASCFVLYSTFIAIMFTTETDDEMRDVCAYYQQFFEGYECKCQLDEDWAANYNYAWLASYYNGQEGGGGADDGEG
mmetsp:Transcript_7173/g.14797  ORF Transcript_7173/g.14797 Transcript_7173/m.14797 type:complete len:379 (-) Transcript_7173:66-1202(-)